jgi:hypothetical protein
MESFAAAGCQRNVTEKSHPREQHPTSASSLDPISWGLGRAFVPFSWRHRMALHDVFGHVLHSLVPGVGEDFVIARTAELLAGERVHVSPRYLGRSKQMLLA